MKLVVGGSFGFLLALVLNVAATLDASVRATGPAISHAIDQRMLFVPAWAFLAPSVWGFNARWLPAFIGLRSAVTLFATNLFVTFGRSRAHERLPGEIRRNASWVYWTGSAAMAALPNSLAGFSLDN